MLTEKQIEDIIYPYVKRQSEFNLSVITIIADRLSRIASFDSIDTMDRWSIMQTDIQNIQYEYDKYKKEQRKRIHDDFWWIAFYLYGEAAYFYEQQMRLEANRELTNLINQSIAQAQTNFETLVKNPVIVMRDLANPSLLRPYNLEQSYRTVINEALNYRNLSDELSNIALKRTETQLFDSGVRYARNDTTLSVNDTISANNAVRMNVLESTKNLINEMQNTMGNQFGADGVELSAHIYPAPDHAPAQGHQYTLENIAKMQSAESFEDVDGNQYEGFVRKIGEWNCRHYFMKIKLGSKPTYTQEQLNKILEDNERGYTDANGRHYTLYECTQIQRRYERNIRNAKEKYLFSKAIKDTNSMSVAKTRVNALMTQYKQFSNACGIPIQRSRISVKDY